MCVYEKITRSPKKTVKIKSFGFCNNIHHTANTCPTKFNIGQIIDGDVLRHRLDKSRRYIYAQDSRCRMEIPLRTQFQTQKHST